MQNDPLPMDGFYDAVVEFNEAFDTPQGVDFWLGLIEEETFELVEAMAIDLSEAVLENHANVLKEACDLLYVSCGLKWAMGLKGLTPAGEAVHQIGRLLGDVIEVYGPDAFTDAFFRVHESNMSKLGDDGKPVRREDGKVLKGPNYKPPVLLDLALASFSRSQARQEFSPYEFQPA